VNERQIRGMIVARQFLERAEVLGEDGTETGRMAAVVLADLSVEMATKAAVLDQPLGGRARLDQDPPLPLVLEKMVELWQKREDSDEDVPEAREARRLHELRNSVQHAGLAPSPDQVVQSRLQAKGLLAWVAAKWFQIDLEAISRARLIENEGVRELVEQADRAAVREDYGDAAGFLAVAFEMARRDFRAGVRRPADLLRGRPITSSAVSAAVSEVRRGGGDQHALGYRRFDDLMRAFAHQLDRLNDQVEALSLGARASDYTWFKQNFPGVGARMRAGGVVDLFPTPGAEISRSVYLRGLDFVTTTALHWQEFPPSSEDTQDA
jgi:hypothetical protein